MVNNGTQTTRYSNGKIYKIVCNTTRLIYVGSTTKEFLSQRLVSHRADYKRWKLDNTNHYYTSFKVLENDNFKIVLLELVNCNTKDELTARERYHIESTDCVNKYIPLRSYKEYCDANRDEINKKAKEYRDANRDEINKKAKEYCDANRDEINKKQNEKYAENKDEIKKKQKEYQQKNKDELKKKAKEKRDANRDEINKKRRDKRAAKKREYMELYPLLFPK
tara:strand:- start:3676 stop:4341 length:666 start_codon:yes stop_codon:yes gene_type:complete